MEIVTSWMEEGIAQGVQQGIAQGVQQGVEQGEVKLLLRQLARKIGELPGPLVESIRALKLSEIEALGEALLDFDGGEDLDAWLSEHGIAKS